MDLQINIHKACVSILILLFCSFNSWCQQLDDYKWNNRLLIIKANELIIKKLDTQMKRFQKVATKLKERKFCIVEVLNNSYRITNFLNGTTASEWKKIKKHHKQFSDTSDFEVLLIGLDGGVKSRYTDLVNPEDIFTKVDAMPMRIRELKNKQKQ